MFRTRDSSSSEGYPDLKPGEVGANAAVDAQPERQVRIAAPP